MKAELEREISVLQHHHDPIHHPHHHKCDEYANSRCKRTSTRPPPLGCAEHAHTGGTFLGGVPCGEFSGGVEVDEEEGTEGPEEWED